MLFLTNYASLFLKNCNFRLDNFFLPLYDIAHKGKDVFWIYFLQRRFVSFLCQKSPVSTHYIKKGRYQFYENSS